MPVEHSRLRRCRNAAPSCDGVRRCPDAASAFAPRHNVTSGPELIHRRGPEWAPGVAQFRGYKRAWLRGDLLAGLTVAAYLIPQVMAYATLAGFSPIAGLWAALGTVVDLRPGRIVAPPVCRSRSRPPR